MVVEAKGNVIPKEKVSQKSNTKPATFLLAYAFVSTILGRIPRPFHYLLGWPTGGNRSLWSVRQIWSFLEETHHCHQRYFSFGDSVPHFHGIHSTGFLRVLFFSGGTRKNMEKHNTNFQNHSEKKLQQHSRYNITDIPNPSLEKDTMEWFCTWQLDSWTCANFQYPKTYHFPVVTFRETNDLKWWHIFSVRIPCL